MMDPQLEDVLDLLTGPGEEAFRRLEVHLSTAMALRCMAPFRRAGIEEIHAYTDGTGGARVAGAAADEDQPAWAVVVVARYQGGARALIGVAADRLREEAGGSFVRGARRTRRSSPLFTGLWPGAWRLPGVGTLATPSSTS